MKMEMDGKEPMIILFGVPVLTTAIVLASIYLGRLHIPQTINVDAKLTPKIEAELRVPEGGIKITNDIPPAQIHEYPREVVKVPTVKITNQVPSSPPPEVRVNVSKPRMPEPKREIVPVPVAAPEKYVLPPVQPKKREKKPEKKPAAESEGDLLPPPRKPSKTKP